MSVPDRAPLAMATLKANLSTTFSSSPVAVTPRNYSIAVLTSVMCRIITMSSKSQWLSASSRRRSTSESTSSSRISCEIALWYGLRSSPMLGSIPLRLKILTVAALLSFRFRIMRKHIIVRCLKHTKMRSSSRYVGRVALSLKRHPVLADLKV